MLSIGDGWTHVRVLKVCPKKEKNVNRIPLDLWHVWSQHIEMNILPGQMLLNKKKAIVQNFIISGERVEGKLVPQQQIITHYVLEFLP